MGSKMAEPKSGPSMTNPGVAGVAAEPEKGFKETLKEDAVEIAYRATAWQLTKRMKAVIVEMLSERVPEAERGTFAAQLRDLMETDVGDVLTGMLFSLALPYGAGFIGQNGPKVERLAHEMRLHAGTVAASGIADKLIDRIGKPLVESLKALPDPMPVRHLEAAPAADGELVFERQRSQAPVPAVKAVP